MTPPDPPYDLPRLKTMTQSLRDLLLGAAQSTGQADQRQALTEVADSFQSIVQNFEIEHGKVDAEIAAKLAEAQKKMEQAQATMLQVEEQAKLAESPLPVEPDWSLGPRLRDELLARRAVVPPPPAIDPSGSLAPWALSPEPVPQVPTPMPAPPPAVRPGLVAAQSVASWLADSPPMPGQPPASAPAVGDASHGSIVSWMFSAEPEASANLPPHSQEAWKEATKQWLAKSRGASPKPKD